MDWDNKVVWHEGLFLQPQHLQQQERYFEHLVRGSTTGIAPFNYGFTQLDIDMDMLGLGKFAIRSAAGILPDGTPFDIPRDVDCPPPIDLPETLRNATIYLLLPDRQPGAIETAPAEMLETAARYTVARFDASDTNSGYQSSADVPIGKLRMRLAHEHESRAGFSGLGVARVVEVRPDRAVVTDENFIPPVLVFGVSALLIGFASQLQGWLNHRAEELSGRLTEAMTRGAAATRGTADISDFLVLQICNRYEPVIVHMASAAGQLHPEAIYRILLSLAGELATFTETGRKRPPVFPPYRHDDLSATFRPVIAALRQYLSAVLDRNAIPIPLQETKSGVLVGEITDSNLVTDATWVLVVGAHLPRETLRRNFPNQVKIGPVENIRDLIMVALPGIQVSAMSESPRQLPYYANRSYFELDRTGAYWAALSKSAGIAIHVTGSPPGLEIECWAIRG